MARTRFPIRTGQTRSGERYDGRHGRARAAAAAMHLRTDPCTRCGRALGPMGRWLHFDHADDGSGRYLGFAHASCNTRAGARLGNLRRRQKHMSVPRRQSRDWYSTHNDDRRV